MKSIPILSRILIQLIFIFFFLSCDPFSYEPEGENVVDIKIPANTMSIQLGNLAQGDTIYAWGEIHFSFSNQIHRTDIVSSTLYLDTKIINSQLNYQEAPSFESYDYPNGIYTLKLVVLSKTNSGSLADKLNTEVFRNEYSWIMYIDNSPLPTQGIQMSETADGRLKLTWNKYNGPGFQNYTLSYGHDHFNTSENHQILISNPNVTEWVDSDFVGGYASVSFVLKAKNRSSNSILLSKTFTKTEITTLGNNSQNTITVNYTKTPFAGNFNKYILQRRVNIFNLETFYDIDSTDDINKTSLRDSSIIFGSPLLYRVLTRAVRSGVYSDLKESQFGELKFIPISRLYYFPEKQSIYLYGDNSVQRIDPLTLDILASSNDAYEFEISSNGNHAVSLGSDHYGPANWRKKVHVMNPMTLAKEKTISLDKVFNKSQIHTHRAFPDDAGNVLMNVYSTAINIFFRGTTVMGLSSETIKIFEPYLHYIYEATPDRKYFTQSDGLAFHVADTSIVQVDNWPSYKHWVNDHDYIKSNPNGQIEIIDATTQQVVTTYTLSQSIELTGISLDLANKMLGGKSGQYYWIFSTENGSLLKKIPVSQPCFFASSTLFSQNGYVLKLKL